MVILLLAFLIGTLVIGSSTLFQFWQRRARAARFRRLILKPNVLLTRYPIAFLSGPRSLFRLFDHWNDIPRYLREHGYEVCVIEPSGRTQADRRESVCTAFESFKTRCHLVADGSLEPEMQTLANLRLSQVASLTVVKSPHRERYFTRAMELSVRDLKPNGVAVETFEIREMGEDARTPTAQLKLILLGAHNFIMKGRTFFVHPFETAEVPSRHGFRSEEHFLDLAISLAERDLIGSD